MERRVGYVRRSEERGNGEWEWEWMSLSVRSLLLWGGMENEMRNWSQTERRKRQGERPIGMAALECDTCRATPETGMSANSASILVIQLRPGGLGVSVHLVVPWPLILFAIFRLLGQSQILLVDQIVGSWSIGMQNKSFPYFCQKIKVLNMYQKLGIYS